MSKPIPIRTRHEKSPERSDTRRSQSSLLDRDNIPRSQPRTTLAGQAAYTATASPPNNYPTSGQIKQPASEFSALGRGFLQYAPLRNVRAAFRYVESNPEVLREQDFERRYMTEGVIALGNNDVTRARSCIEKLVYIKHCRGIRDSEIKKYFDNLRDQQPKLLQVFDDDFAKYWDRCQDSKEARVRQRERTDPSAIHTQQQGLRSLVNKAGGLNINKDDRHAPDPQTNDDNDDDDLNDRKGLGKTYESKDSLVRHSKKPDSKKDDLASEISKPSFQGTRGEEERLDPRYYRRTPREAGSLLQVGRVFAILRHSEHSGEGLGQVKWKVTTKLGVEIFSHICRMVVVKECHGVVWAIPINTYSGHGVGKRGFNQADIDAHAIVYMRNESPRTVPHEPPMRKTPIEVIPVGGETLDAASRINFSKPHSIDHNVKFLDIGKVAQESMPYLNTYWKQYRC